MCVGVCVCGGEGGGGGHNNEDESPIATHSPRALDFTVHTYTHTLSGKAGWFVAT